MAYVLLMFFLYFSDFYQTNYVNIYGPMSTKFAGLVELWL